MANVKFLTGTETDLLKRVGDKPDGDYINPIVEGSLYVTAEPDLLGTWRSALYYDTQGRRIKVSGGTTGGSGANDALFAHTLHYDGESSSNTTVVTTLRNINKTNYYNINFPAASEISAGVVTTGAQTFAGNKTFTGRVYINNTNEADSGTAGSGALIIGDENLWHVVIDGDEIIAKQDATTSGILHLQTDGGETQIGGNLGVNGTTKLNNTLEVAEGTQLKKTLTVEGISYFNNATAATGKNTGALQIKGGISVNAESYFDAPVTFNGGLTLNDSLTVKKNVSIEGTLTVALATLLKSTLEVTGKASLKDALEVTGATNLLGTLGVIGATALSGTLGVNGKTTLNDELDVVKSAMFQDDINVQGIAKFNKNEPADNTGSKGGVRITGGVYVGNTSYFNGDVTFGKDVEIIGATTLTGGVKGDLIMLTGGSSIHWNDGGTHRQRIKTTDNDKVNDAVFTFQESADSGLNYNDLFTIRDNGVIVLTKNIGRLTKLYDAVSTVPAITIGSLDKDITVLKMGHSSTGDNVDTGYAFKYIGSGSGVNNRFEIYADGYQTGASTDKGENLAISINQISEIGLGTVPATDYRLNVSGKVKITGNSEATAANTGQLQVTGGISVSAKSWFGKEVIVEGGLYIGSALAANAILYLNNKIALRGVDSWLRINDTVAFASGVYFGKSLVMTDNELRVRKSDGSANTFYANSSGNAYVSNTLGIAGINTDYNLYVKGTTFLENTTYFGQTGQTGFYVTGAGDARFNTVGINGNNTGYRLYVNGTSYLNGNVYLPSNGNIFAIGTKATHSIIRVIDNTSDANGNGISIGGGGLTVVGAGESASSFVTSTTYGGDEKLYLLSDGVINLESCCDTITNRIGFQITTAGALIPIKAEAGQANMQTIGNTSYYTKGVYSRWFHANTGNAADDGGITLYGADSTYAIYTRKVANGGSHAYVNKDWITYFAMNRDDATGWIFKSGSNNVASISGAGYITANRLVLNTAGNKASYGRISWYQYNYLSWIDYMAQPIATYCPTGGTPSSTVEVNDWALRSLIQNNTSGYGWIWETTDVTTTAVTNSATKAIARMSLSSKTGRLRLEGDASSSSNQTGQLIISSALNGSNGNTAIELWRGDKYASWQIANEGGVFYIRNNYTTATQSKYSVNSLILDYNTGAASLPYLAIGQTERNTTYKLYVKGTSYFIEHAFLHKEASLIQYQDNTSNYTTAIKWYKNSKSQAAYDPQIGQHNIGGSANTGSITILPYATATSPWGGAVGLFIQKDILKLDGKRVPTTGNDTGTVGTGVKPIYSNAGILTASSVTVGAADRPMYLASGTMTQTTYRMAATNVTATSALDIGSTPSTGIWYVNGTSGILNQTDGAAIVNVYNSSWIAQIYQDYRTGQIALRGKNNGTWQAWRIVLDNANYTTHLNAYYDSRYVNVSGDTMTGNLTIKKSTPQLYFQMTGFTKATPPASNTSKYYLYTTDSAAAVISAMREYYYTSGANFWEIVKYNTNATSGSVNFRMGYDASGNSYISSTVAKATFTKVYGAVWNDYAEFRRTEQKIQAGRVVIETKYGNLVLSTKRMQPGGNIVSDTFGFAIGETENCKTPIAVSGRVLAYPYEEKEFYEPGDAVCSGPNGTVSKMTREEIREYPERIVGTVSEIPTYETWGEDNVKVNGRIWIKVK